MVTLPVIPTVTKHSHGAPRVFTTFKRCRPTFPSQSQPASWTKRHPHPHVPEGSECWSMWATAVLPDRQGWGSAGPSPPIPWSTHVRTLTLTQQALYHCPMHQDTQSQRWRLLTETQVLPHGMPWLTWPPTASLLHSAQYPRGQPVRSRADSVAQRFPKTNQTPTKSSMITRHPKLSFYPLPTLQFPLGRKGRTQGPCDICVRRLMTSLLTPPNNYFSQRKSTRGQLHSFIFSHCS